MQTFKLFVAQKLKQLSTEAKVFLIVKGIIWAIIAIAFTCFGNFVSKLIWLDDFLFAFTILSTIVALKNSETRDEIFYYIFSVNYWIKTKIIGEDIKVMEGENDKLLG